MRRYTFILNPQAGKGKAKNLRPKVYNAIKGNLPDEFDIVETTHVGDATRIASESTSQVVVAIGGDGTVHEVANGIIGSEKILGIIPAGSGNDFIKSILVPAQFDQALACLVEGRVKQVDVGRVEVLRASGASTGNPLPSYFVNGLGMGFDAAVADRTRHIPFASGTLLYILAVLQTLGRYKAPTFTTRVDGREGQSKNLLIAIGNGVCAGGGFYLTPSAKVDDGILDLCLIGEMSAFEILRLMPKVMRGKHQDCKSVTFATGKEINIKSNYPVAVHSDGEIIATDAMELRTTVVPQALRVIAG